MCACPDPDAVQLGPVSEEVRVGAGRELAASVSAFYLAIRRFIVDKEQMHGATAIQYGILSMLRTPARAKTLASLLGLSESALSRHISTLEGEGLITRSADPTDGRAQLITLTEKGWAELRDYSERRLSVFLQRLQGWDAPKLKEAASLVEELREALSGLPLSVPLAPPAEGTATPAPTHPRTETP